MRLRPLTPGDHGAPIMTDDVGPMGFLLTLPWAALAWFKQFIRSDLAVWLVVLLISAACTDSGRMMTHQAVSLASRGGQFLRDPSVPAPVAQRLASWRGLVAPSPAGPQASTAPPLASLRLPASHAVERGGAASLRPASSPLQPDHPNLQLAV